MAINHTKYVLHQMSGGLCKNMARKYVLLTWEKGGKYFRRVKDMSGSTFAKLPIVDLSFCRRTQLKEEYETRDWYPPGYLLPP
jgi:hypothetical protein